MTGGWVGPRRRTEAAIDPGLQSERTAMAWQRTALGIGGVSALLIHHANGNVIAALPGVIGLMVALGVLLIAEIRYERMMRRVLAGETPTRGAMLRLVAATAVGLAVAALVLIIVNPG